MEDDNNSNQDCESFLTIVQLVNQTCSSFTSDLVTTFVEGSDSPEKSIQSYPDNECNASSLLVNADIINKVVIRL